jgi:hypothetical protein
MLGHPPTQFIECCFPEAPRRRIQGPAGYLRGLESSLLERALLQRAREPDLQRRGNSQGTRFYPHLGPQSSSTHPFISSFSFPCFYFLTQSAFENEWRARTVLPPPPRTSPPPTSAQKVHGHLAIQQPQPDRVATPTPGSVALTPSVNSAAAATQQQPPTKAETPSAPTTEPLAPQQTTASASSQQQPSSPPRMSSPDMDVDVGGTPEPETLGADDMAHDGESDLIVQQLERGLPRWEGFGDFGWLEEKEGSEDRWLELVLAIKGHKDAVYVSPSILHPLPQILGPFQW